MGFVQHNVFYRVCIRKRKEREGPTHDYPGGAMSSLEAAQGQKVTVKSALRLVGQVQRADSEPSS